MVIWPQLLQLVEDVRQPSVIPDLVSHVLSHSTQMRVFRCPDTSIALNELWIFLHMTLFGDFDQVGELESMLALGMIGELQALPQKSDELPPDIGLGSQHRAYRRAKTLFNPPFELWIGKETKREASVYTVEDLTYFRILEGGVGTRLLLLLGQVRFLLLLLLLCFLHFYCRWKVLLVPVLQTLILTLLLWQPHAFKLQPHRLLQALDQNRNSISHDLVGVVLEPCVDDTWSPIQLGFGFDVAHNDKFRTSQSSWNLIIDFVLVSPPSISFSMRPGLLTPNSIKHIQKQWRKSKSPYLRRYFHVHIQTCQCK